MAFDFISYRCSMTHLPIKYFVYRILKKIRGYCRSQTSDGRVTNNRSPRYVFPSIILTYLALQGAFLEHINHLNALRHLSTPPFTPIEVRTECDLKKCQALIIPGGESTTIALVAEREGLLEPLRDFVRYCLQ